MRAVRVIQLAALVALVASLGTATGDAAGRATATSVTVDLRATRQVIQGFGTSSRVWSDPHLANSSKTVVPPEAQQEILRALYGRLGLTRVRPVLDQGVQKAPGGPFAFGGKLADEHVAFVRQARAFGLKTVFPGPVYLEPWMKADDPAPYVDWAIAMLQRWREQGVELELYAPLNEPYINGNFPPSWFHDMVLQLGGRMRAAGFATRLVIPDDENPTAAYRRAVAVLSDPRARQYVGALAYHVYQWDRADMVRLRELATRYRLPVWMTEYSSRRYADWSGAFDWAVRMHVLLTEGGVNAIDYMWGFFGSWVRTDTLASIDFADGLYRGVSYTPLYWITGQYSRYVRPGYVRVAATAASPSLLVSAYKGPKRVVVVATNTGASEETVRVAIKGLRLRGVVRGVRSSESEQWRSLSPLAPRNGTLDVSLPPHSVTTLLAVRP